MNYFSKEGFETGIFIGAQIAGEKPRPVREYSAVANHRQYVNPRLLAGAFENGGKSGRCIHQRK
jgi:hypothetical protein